MRRGDWLWGLVTTAGLVTLLAAGCGQRGGETRQPDAGARAEAGDEGPCPSVAEADRTKVVAQVGETEITVCEVTEALNKMSPYLRKAYEAPEKRRQFVDNMIRFELIAQEAARRGYGEDEEVQRVEKQMMIQRLNKELQDSVQLSDITEEEMRAYYQEHADEYHKAEMVRIARVLLGTEAECERTLASLREKAADARYFREVALERSIDTRTKDQGGDLPYFPRAEERTEGDPEIDPALIEPAFSLDMREPLYDKCVKTSDGWNVIRLRGRRKARDLSFDDVSRQIRHRMHRDRLSKSRDDLVANLRESAKITVNDEALGRIRVEAPPEEAVEGMPGMPGMPGIGPGAAPGAKAPPPPPRTGPGAGKAPGGAARVPPPTED